MVLISNSPRPVARRDRRSSTRWACRARPGSAIVTSGDATRVLLAERAPGPAWAIGPERDAPLYEGLGLEFAEPEDAAFISCTGPFDDEIETPEDYRERLDACAARAASSMICANPDQRRAARRPADLLRRRAGRALREPGRPVIMAGKPYRADLRAGAGRGGGAARARRSTARRVLCIGDGLPTDVRGRQRPGPGLPVHRQRHPRRRRHRRRTAAATPRAVAGLLRQRRRLHAALRHAPTWSGERHAGDRAGSR